MFTACKKEETFNRTKIENEGQYSGEILPGDTIFCEKESPIYFLTDCPGFAYYGVDIFSGDLEGLYGLWELYKVTGGWSGEEQEPNFDFLEIKQAGAYALVRSDSVFECGKLVITEPYDPESTDVGIRFEAKGFSVEPHWDNGFEHKTLRYFTENEFVLIDNCNHCNWYSFRRVE